MANTSIISPQKNLQTRVKMPEMIAVPSGDFYMGTSESQVEFMLQREDWAEDWLNRDMFQVEQPYHRVHLPAFEIGRFPVTNAEYHLFTWNANYRVPRHWLGFHYAEEEALHPVVNISREDAQAYIRWLNEKLGLTGSQAFRLPTEAEWERAARGDDGRIYPWGNEFDPWRCNTQDGGRGWTSVVGLYSPGGDSPFGVHDMGGNVWEWTSSLMRPYPYDPADGREEAPGPGERVVIRGGGWYYSHKMARCSVREGVLPGYTSESLGFRLARG